MLLRGKREEAAGKLLQKVPELASLSLDIRETRSNGSTNDTQYIRRVVVEHAHALFEMPCSYSSCSNGGYDATREILAALASRAPRFEGETVCRGSCGGEFCSRVLRYVATATYRPLPGVS
ncbi:hypothetical protein SOCE26_072890 [Sorangium cellulosum]|uniref:Uncharacterized protein n=1 Tax=Sorangium cellulosum TaxID=56 RepID=A0A2L0F2N5_SORCE|nr:hypothetical protein [Sorangium cellulosum]AUX45793.1 hypothetical protein SOCE26_072890 [Sorangium cellulosum]